MKRPKRNGGWGLKTVRKLMVRHNNKCGYCGRPVYIKHHLSMDDDRATIDHVIPISRGGTHAQDNLRLACRKCNEAKGNMPPWMFDAVIIRELGAED